MGRLGYHITRVFMSGFYNAIQLGEISTWPNWYCDQKSWKYKVNFRLDI